MSSITTSLVPKESTAVASHKKHHSASPKGFKLQSYQIQRLLANDPDNDTTATGFLESTQHQQRSKLQKLPIQRQRHSNRDVAASLILAHHQERSARRLKNFVAKFEDTETLPCPSKAEPHIMDASKLTKDIQPARKVGKTRVKAVRNGGSPRLVKGRQPEFCCPIRVNEAERYASVEKRCVRGQGFKDIARLNEHLRRYHSLPYWCLDCKTNFAASTVQELESKKQNHKCVPRNWTKEEELASHTCMTEAQQKAWGNGAWKNQKLEPKEPNTPLRNWKKIFKSLYPDTKSYPNPYCDSVNSDYDEDIDLVGPVPSGVFDDDLGAEVGQSPEFNQLSSQSQGQNDHYHSRTALMGRFNLSNIITGSTRTNPLSLDQQPINPSDCYQHKGMLTSGTFDESFNISSGLSPASAFWGGEHFPDEPSSFGDGKSNFMSTDDGDSLNLSQFLDDASIDYFNSLSTVPTNNTTGQEQESQDGRDVNDCRSET